LLDSTLWSKTNKVNILRPTILHQSALLLTGSLSLDQKTAKAKTPVMGGARKLVIDCM